MKELMDIVAAYERAVKENKKTALATVVLVEGSAYRRAGARMLITEDGQLTGAISGGCLEGDALRKARMVIMQQEALLVTYDTMDDEAAINSTGYSVLVTLFSTENRKAPQPGSILFFSDRQMISNGFESIPYKNELLADVEDALVRQQSIVSGYRGYTAFIECVKPLISLVILGAGNDAIPLTKMSAILGWNTSIVDGRPNYATSDRFPLVNKIIVAKPEKVLESVEFKEWTAFVLMTHNYNYELAFLQNILPLHPLYIGVLGPKKKLERMLSELADAGIFITERDLEAIHGPIGLDIGSETSEEIALAIVAEIKAFFSDRNGQPLKYKNSVIHSA